MKYTDKNQLKYWSKVEVASDDECWEWLGSITNGYGMFNMNGGKYYAHRLSWVFENGNIPDSLHVLHKCDNGTCVNPNHLFLGTHTDNMRDKAVKGRCGDPKSGGTTCAYLVEKECITRIPNGEFKRLKSKGLAYGVNHRVTKVFLKNKDNQ